MLASNTGTYSPPESNFNGSIHIIDGKNNAKTGEKELGVSARPSGIGVNSDTDKIYIVDRGQNTLTVVNGKLE